MSRILCRNPGCLFDCYEASNMCILCIADSDIEAINADETCVRARVAEVSRRNREERIEKARNDIASDNDYSFESHNE